MRTVIEGVSPQVALRWNSILDEIPESIHDRVTDLSLRNPVKNSGLPYYYFTNSSLFTPAANTFRESEANTPRGGTPSYTPYLEGTTAWKQFWRQEHDRCIHGYEPEIDGVPCGIRITGEHYFYLNYCRIVQKYEDPVTGKVTKREDFPEFLSMDFYWFHMLERAENPERFGLSTFDKRHIIMAKARRKGWSYKNAAGAVYVYSFVPNGKVVIGSQFGDKGRITFNMAMTMIDFLNKYTEFGQPWVQRRQTKNDCFILSGAEEDIDGVKTYKGIRTSIETVSFKDKPDAAAGLYATRFLFEEAGQIEQLKSAFEFSEPTLRDGDFLTGIAIIYGTGGDMEKGAKEFSEMFYKPKEHGLMDFENIYEEGESSGFCGWFVDDMWFRPGEITIEGKKYQAVDENGNAHRWVAEITLDKEREVKKKSSRETYSTFVTQRCKTPAEAFLIVQGNVFPVAELQSIYSKKRAHNEFNLLGRNGKLVDTLGITRFVPDLRGDLFAIDSYPIRTERSKDGCVIQYEAPREIEGFIQPGAYVVCMDPIDIDDEGAESLCAIYVLKTMKYAPIIGGDEIVMEYVGRPKEDTIDTCNRIAFMMCKYYNAKLSHENDRGGKVVSDFFIKNNAYHMLLKPPARMVSGHIQNSRTLLRKVGHSMSSPQMKELGEIYLKRWLLTIRGYNNQGVEVRNMDLIPSKALYEELIMYNRLGNFDRVLALMGGVLQMQELFNEFKEENSDPKETMGKWFSDRIQK